MIETNALEKKLGALNFQVNILQYASKGHINAEVDLVGKKECGISLYYVFHGKG